MSEYVSEILQGGIDLLPSDIYDMTLAELVSVLDGWNQRMRFTKIMFGTVSASIYNTAQGRKRHSRAVRWNDIFLDSPTGCAGVQFGEKMSNEEIKNKLMCAFGGGMNGDRN